MVGAVDQPVDGMAELRRAALVGPDPSGAPTRVERFLAATDDAGGMRACVPTALAAELVSLLTAQSDWLSTAIIRDPRAVSRLAADPYLRREKSEATMRRELAMLLEESDDLARTLRRYRNGEYLRLGARELGMGTAAEVGRELSGLASACLDAALIRVHAELERRHGPPLTDAGKRCRFVVFGMGKLGGEELNFSSDIDLVYLYETDAGAAGELSLHQYFSKVSERLTRVISEVTDDGFVFRVDLRLRPEGSRGAICNSLAAAESYYESFGRPWERQAWLKARPVAGDPSLGEEVLEVLAPFIWPRSTGPDVIRHVHELMTKIRAELGDPDDVKVGPGGIREIEFFVQALQMVHGRAPAVRERGTLRALDKLLFAGVVSDAERRALAEAYVFLRRVEHRLQLDGLRQTHALPADPERRALVARRLGSPSLEAFDDQLGRVRRRVADIYATLGAPDSPPRPAIARLADPSQPREQVIASLAELGFASPEASADEIALLHAKPHSPFAQTEALGAALLDEVSASPDPDLALRRLVDLVGRRGAASSIWRLIEMHRPLARLLMSLFGTSEFLSKELIAHPELVEPLLSARQAQPVRTRADIDALVAAGLSGLDDEEQQLNALRRLKREEVLRIGLFDVAGELEPARVTRQLSDLAESLLDAVVRVVQPAVFHRYGAPSATLAVVGLGKLGGAELSYSSDLDLVFVYSGEGQARGGREASHHEVFTRLAQRIVHGLTTFLDEGRLYEIDTRLRPSGQQGALVSSLEAFRSYHRHEAQLWERQALIKARTVAGDRTLGDAIELITLGHVYGPQPAGTAQRIAAEIGRLRARVERELAHESAHRFNIKSGRGGLLDVEFLVQYLQLREGPRLPSLRVRSTLDALEALRDEGVLPAGEARELAESYAFLRKLEARLRIVHDRSIHEIHDDPKELSKLARRLAYHGEEPGARLLADYKLHVERVRAIHARYLPAP
jgi:glutamate-ammonia-ligase adenylyltransferase